MTPGRRGRRDRGIDLAVTALLAFALLGPVLLRRGFALRGDMVLVPRQPWKDAWLALDGSAPRFVPGDAILSVATTVLPGDLLQKLLLLGALLLAGAGAGRLVADRAIPGRVAAIVLFVWNPWVFERLSIGQWGSVVGYAALPWVVSAAVSLRDDVRRGWPAVTLWLGFAALWSPAAGLIGALTAFCVVVVGPRPRRALLTLVAAGVVNLPWLLPSLLSSDRIASPGEQFEAFAARAESGAGLVASVVSLGGIWKASVVPGERTVAVVVLLSCVTTVAALVSLWRGRSRRDDGERRTVAGLGLLALAAVALTVLPALPGVTALLDDAARHAPGLAVLRDGHRFLGPAVLLLLPGIAAAVDGLWARARAGTEALRAVAALVAVLPVVCLPSMTWGLTGALRPVTYPDEWSGVADTVEQDLHDRGGATVVLPWHGTYRGFAWNGRRAFLDPAPRFLPGEVLIDDRIYLGERVLDNEDPRLAAVTSALEQQAPASSLAGLGVARVLVEKGNGVDPDDIPDGDVLHDGKLLTLVSVGVPEERTGLDGARRILVVGGDVAAVTALVIAGACIRRRQVYGERAVRPGRGKA